MSGITDWLTRMKEHVDSPHDELDLAVLRCGDILTICTRNTQYTLRVLGDRFAEVMTNRENRPVGRMKIMGCTFGLSSTISPNHLFCGGNLELTFVDQGVTMTHTTSSIRRIELLQRDPAAA